MAKEETTTTETEEESSVWMYQVRNKNGDVISEFSTPAEADFKWPTVGKDQQRYMKKGQRWQKVK